MNRSINCSFRVLSAVLIVAAPVARAQESIHELPAHRIAETIRKFQNARIPNMETPATLFALPDAKWHEGDVAILTPIVNNKWNLHWIRTSGSEIVAVDENSLESFLKTEQIDLNALAESGATTPDEVIEFLAVDTVHVRMEDEFAEGQPLNVETEDGSMTMKTKIVRLTSDEGLTVIGRTLETTTVISTSNIQGLSETQDLGTIRYFHTTGYVEQETIATSYFDQLKIIATDHCGPEKIDVPQIHHRKNPGLDDWVFAYDTKDDQGRQVCGIASVRFSINGTQLTRHIDPTPTLSLTDADALAEELARSANMDDYHLPQSVPTAEVSDGCLIENAVTAAQGQLVFYDPFAGSGACVITYRGETTAANTAWATRDRACQLATVNDLNGTFDRTIDCCLGGAAVGAIGGGGVQGAVGGCVVVGTICLIGGIIFDTARALLCIIDNGSLFEQDVIAAEATLEDCCEMLPGGDCIL